METSVDCNQDDVVAGSTHIEGNFIHNPPSKMNPAKYQCLIVKSLLMANPQRNASQIQVMLFKHLPSC